MRLVRIVVAALVLAASSATAQVRPVHVPIEFEDSRVYVPVSAGGTARGWFILDTGATDTILDRRFAAALHLGTKHTQLVHGAGAGASEQGELGRVMLRVGAASLDVAKASAMDLAVLLGPTSGRDPAGIIGSQFFREHTVEVDFRRHELRVWPRGTDLTRRYVRSVPVTFAGWTPLASAQLTLPSGERLKEHVLLDLGAKSTLLIPEPFIAKHRLDTAFPRSVTLPLGAGVGGNTYYSFARARRIALGGDPALAVEAPIVGLSANGTLRASWHEGLLGADYLSRFAIAFDYSRSRVLLTRLSSRAEPLDRSGLFLVWSGDPARFTVRDVLAGGPGEKAGVRPGDALVRIEGRRAGALTLSAIRATLKLPASSVALVISRGGRELPLSLQLADLL